MGMGRYVVDAVLSEGRSAREVARAHGISKSWIYELIGRLRAGRPLSRCDGAGVPRARLHLLDDYILLRATVGRGVQRVVRQLSFFLDVPVDL